MTAQPPWSADQALRHVCAILDRARGETRIVGGAVRDWQLGRPIGDIDLATTLLPDQVMKALRADGLQVIPTGLEHGTVTAIHAGRAFEITTLRLDVKTDGRRAVVSFTTDWRADALRRDFTINCLSSSLDGELHDPLGSGLADCRAGLLRFAGDARQRIREDYLRILRFYRFQAQMALKVDAASADACTALKEGLKGLSAERIWQEMRKLFAGPHREAVLSDMLKSGVLATILPEAEESVGDINPQLREPVLVLAALVGNEAAASGVAKRWKLSKADAKRLNLALPALPADIKGDIRALKRLAWREGIEAVSDRLKLAGAAEMAETLSEWTIPANPVKGRDVLARGVTPGPRVGALVSEVIDWWVSQDFAPSGDECLQHLDRLISRD